MSGDKGSGMRKHGAYKTPEYRAWQGMLRRCYTPTTTKYNCYGGSGVTVCDRWRKSFENFLSDVGPRPSPKHSIDRYPDSHGNYEPSNVRWATQKEQCNNKRNNRRLMIDGISMTVAQIAEKAQLPYSVVSKRVGRGKIKAEDLMKPSLRPTGRVGVVRYGKELLRTPAKLTVGQEK